jgi:FkbH-like protein
MKVTIEDLSRANLDRAAQLLNKTNQMNLSTRRLSAAELWKWASAGDRHVWTLRVTDRFGDYGLVGILSVDVRELTGHIVDFVLSCRAMGRQVEQAMMQLAQGYAVSRNLQRLEASAMPTPRNTPCIRFWQQSAWTEIDLHRFVWTATETVTLPQGIQVVGGVLVAAAE